MVQDMRRSSMLVGAGLVLLGVIIGALVTQFIWPQPPVQIVQPKRVVESIQVGNPIYEPPVAALQAASMSSLFKEVARTVTPAVVSITARSGVSRVELPRDGFHNFDEETLRRPFRRSSAGSGVLISKKGHIVTNFHVISEATEIGVLLSDKREYEARVIGTDPSTDLAVLQIDYDEDLPVVTLGNSDESEVGDWVVAIGNPFRLTSTVTAGIISAIGRRVDIIEGMEDGYSIEDFIQTDAAINPGNSGGALVNLNGQLIGINTAIATERGTYEGYGFAVPVNLMTHVVNDLIAYGTVRRGYLGVHIAEVDAEIAGRMGLPDIAGVLVTQVLAGSAAEHAQIQTNDVILSINGYPVNASNELQSRIAQNHPGDSVGVAIWRNGAQTGHHVVLLGRNHAALAPWFSPGDDTTDPELQRPETPFQELEEWGIGLREVNDDDRVDFDLTEGAYIAYVQGGTPASQGGLPRDAIITAIENHPVVTVEDAFRLLDLAYAEEHEAVLIRVRRRTGISSFYEIQVPSMD